MPEDNSAINDTVDNPSQQADLKILESMAFGGYVPEQPNDATQNDNLNQAANTNNNAAPNDEVATLSVEDFLKNELGFDNVDAVKNVLSEYKTLKDNPTKAELKFANDEAKKWYEYLAAGDEDKILESLSRRKQVKGIDSWDDTQRLKQYIRLTNPMFDEELVEDEYKSLYTVDENKYKNDVDETDQLALRKEQLRAKQRVMNDVQKANDYFSQYKSKIELPPITKDIPVDNAYEAYKASTAKDIEHYSNEVEPAIKNLKSTDVGLQLKIADTENQMDFNVSIDVTPEDLETAKNDALNLSNYLDKECYQDGKFVPQKYAQMMLKAKNFDKYAQTIARQAVMAERKRVQLRNATGGNGYGGGMRDYDLGKHDELKSLEAMAFPGQN